MFEPTRSGVYLLLVYLCTIHLSMALSMLATHFPECLPVGMITAVTVFDSGEKV